MEEGPAEVITAGKSPQTAPSAAEHHTRYDTTLISVSGGNGGYVHYPADETLEYLIFLNGVVPVEVLDQSGNAVAILESREVSAYCEAIQARHVVSLQPGDYYLNFGPTDLKTVNIVIEEAE